MAEKSGSSLVVEFGGTDISAKGRSYEIAEDRGEPEKIDVTHRGDTQRQHLESFQGPDNTNVTFTALYDDSGSDPIASLTMGTKATLDLYPEGKAHGSDLERLTNARLITKNHTVPYDGAIEWTTTFNSVDSMTYTTYTTA